MRPCRHVAPAEDVRRHAGFQYRVRHPKRTPAASISRRPAGSNLPGIRAATPEGKSRPTANGSEQRPGFQRDPSLRTGWVTERETLLGSRAEGAFGALRGDLLFGGADGSLRAGAWTLAADAELGVAAPETGGGIQQTRCRKQVRPAHAAGLLHPDRTAPTCARMMRTLAARLSSTVPWPPATAARPPSQR